MMYSEEVLKHFYQASHGGVLKDPSYVSQVGSQEEGRILQLSVFFSEGRFIKVRFKAHGCPVLIACGEWLSKHLEGCSLEDIRKITGNKIIEALQLKSNETYSAYLAEDLLRQLIEGLS